MAPHTSSDSREIPMFKPETVQREVSNDDIWRIRDGESIRNYRETMLMVKIKADRLCYDLDLDLNKLHHLAEFRKRVELTRGESSGVRHQEGPLGGDESDKEEEDSKEEEVMEEEEPYEEVEPIEEGKLHIQDKPDVVMEPLEEENLPDPPLVETEVQSESDIEMWEPKWEPPTYIEISNEDERGN